MSKQGRRRTVAVLSLLGVVASAAAASAFPSPKSIVKKAVGGTKDLANKTTNAVESVAGKAADGAKDAAGKVAGGVTQAAGATASFAEDAADYVANAGEKFLSDPTPVPMPGDFPPPAAKVPAAQRATQCAAAGTPACYPKAEQPTLAGLPTNLLYGWSVGRGHPDSNANPPGYDHMLNGLDQCAWFHDRAAWGYNANTHVCERFDMCANSMGLRRCLDRYKPRNDAEAKAKADFTRFFEKVMLACVPDLYPDYGADFEVDGNGEQWLSARSVAMLRATMARCPSKMKHPGFPEP